MQSNSIRHSAALLMLLISVQPHYAIAVPSIVSDYKVGDRLHISA